MMKLLIAAVFGIALALGGVFTVLGQFGDKGPAVVTSVSIAPMSSGQDSQAKLAPVEPTFTDTFDNLQAASQQLEAWLQNARTAAPGAQTDPSLNSNVQNFVSQVQQVVQNNTQSQVETSAGAASANGTNSTSTSVSTNNGVTTTTVTNNGVTTTTTTGTPSNASAAATSTAASDALAKAIDAYNQVVAKVSALDLPPDIKAALIDYLTSLRSQLLALSIPDSLNAIQTQALTNNPAVDVLNKFLANVNGLNMTSSDKAKTFAALIASFGTVPGVNTSYALPTSTAPSTQVTLPSIQEMNLQGNAQVQAAIDSAMANLEAQRKLTASLQAETNNALFGGQLAGMPNQVFSNMMLGGLNLGALSQPH